MIDDLDAFTLLAARAARAGVAVEGFCRRWTRRRAVIEDGRAVAPDECVAAETHVRVIKGGRLGFGAVSGAPGCWAPAFELALGAAASGSAVDQRGFSVCNWAAPGPDDRPSPVFPPPGLDDLAAAARRAPSLTRTRVVAELIAEEVGISDGRNVASWRSSRAHYSCLGTTRDGTVVVCADRWFSPGPGDGSSVAEAVAAQAAPGPRRTFRGCTQNILLMGGLFPGLVRRFLAFALDGERFAGSSAPAPLAASAALLLTHDPTLPGVPLSAPFDDEGQPAATHDLIRDGEAVGPLALALHPAAVVAAHGGFARRGWLNEPVFDLAGLRVAQPADRHGQAGGTAFAEINRGIAIFDLAEVEYDPYGGTFSGLVMYGRRVEGGRLADRLRPAIGVFVDLRKLLAGVALVSGEPPTAGAEGSSPPVLVSGDCCQLF